MNKPIRIYTAVHKRSGEIIYTKSVSKITGYFPSLDKKKSSILLRFQKLKKQNKPLIINDWGFMIIKGETII